MYSPDLAIYFKRHLGILFWDPVGPPTVHGAQLFGWGFFTFSLSSLISYNIPKLELPGSFILKSVLK